MSNIFITVRTAAVCSVAFPAKVTFKRLYLNRDATIFSSVKNTNHRNVELPTESNHALIPHGTEHRSGCTSHRYPNAIVADEIRPRLVRNGSSTALGAPVVGVVGRLPIRGVRGRRSGPIERRRGGIIVGRLFPRCWRGRLNLLVDDRHHT
jgi:hypothetical protein